MVDSIKYPRTFHHVLSPGIHSDDKIVDDLSVIKKTEIIIMEKLDGENTTMTNKIFHARSLDSPYNFTRAFIKQLHDIIKYDIPENWRLCGENVSYYHSIEYDNLESFFYLFGIWNDKNENLSWDIVKEWAEILDLATPREFYRGPYDEKIVKDIIKDIEKYNLNNKKNQIEGFVARNVDSFHYDDFTKNVFKWVRNGHVQPSANGKEEHWLKRTYENKVADPYNIKPKILSYNNLKI